MPYENTASPAETTFGLSIEELSALRDEIEKLYLKAVWSLAKDREKELLDRQKVTPLIWVTAGEGVLFAIHYCDSLRNIVGRFAEELCLALGSRKRLAKREPTWVDEIAHDFILQKTKEHELRDLFRSCGSRLFTIKNEAAAEQEFINKVGALVESQLLMRDAKAAIRRAEALYGGRRSPPSPKPKRRTPLSQKLADPGSYPSLTVPETSQALGLSRATVYRRLDEDKTLKRTDGGKPEGRRACRIQTLSVLKCLEDSKT
ncbi:MAG: hypothetical protein WBR26_11595 [Candidatus Acidiferrum sp.]